jgi:hypothetical protein
MTLIYYMLRVTAPSFLFQIGIAAAGRVINAVMLALLGLHCFLEPFFHQGLNCGHQISHLLVTPLFRGLLCITGLTSGHGHGIAHPVVPATFLGVVSEMGAAVCLAVLAELCGHALLWDSFTGIPRGRTLLGGSLGDRGSGCFLRLCLETSLMPLVHDALDCFKVL